MTGGKVNSTELVAAMINQKSNFAEGISFAQNAIDGTASILILKEDGAIIAARDRVGRLPVLIGKGEDGYCVSFESFAYKKLGYDLEERELGPGEIVRNYRRRHHPAGAAGGRDAHLCLPVVLLRLSHLYL